MQVEWLMPKFHERFQRIYTKKMSNFGVEHRFYHSTQTINRLILDWFWTDSELSTRIRLVYKQSNCLVQYKRNCNEKYHSLGEHVKAMEYSSLSRSCSHSTVFLISPESAGVDTREAKEREPRIEVDLIPARWRQRYWPQWKLGGLGTRLGSECAY